MPLNRPIIIGEVVSLHAEQLGDVGEGGDCLQHIQVEGLAVPLIGDLPRVDIGVLHPPDDGDQLGAGDAVLRMVRQRAILLQLPGELYLFIEHGDIAIVHVSEGRLVPGGPQVQGFGRHLGHRQPAYRTVQIGHLLPGDKALLQGKVRIAAAPVLPGGLPAVKACRRQHHHQGLPHRNGVVRPEGAVLIAAHRPVLFQVRREGGVPRLRRHIRIGGLRDCGRGPGRCLDRQGRGHRCQHHGQSRQQSRSPHVSSLLLQWDHPFLPGAAGP